jgi:hypothetical protein
MFHIHPYKRIEGYRIILIAWIDVNNILNSFFWNSIQNVTGRITMRLYQTTAIAFNDVGENHILKQGRLPAPTPTNAIRVAQPIMILYAEILVLSTPIGKTNRGNQCMHTSSVPPISGIYQRAQLW